MTDRARRRIDALAVRGDRPRWDSEIVEPKGEEAPESPAAAPDASAMLRDVPTAPNEPAPPTAQLRAGLEADAELGALLLAVLALVRPGDELQWRRREVGWGIWIAGRERRWFASGGDPLEAMRAMLKEGE